MSNNVNGILRNEWNKYLIKKSLKISKLQNDVMKSFLFLLSLLLLILNDLIFLESLHRKIFKIHNN